jgi:hypothetical protein
MSGHIYKQVDLVGSSAESLEDAIRGAIAKASESIDNIEWFEVTQTRGWVDQGQVQHFQVGLKVGFRVD